MDAEKPWQNRETLRELYEDERMSSIEIADHFGDITDAGVRYWIEKHDIEKRSRSEAAKRRWEKEHITPRTCAPYGYEVISHSYEDDDAFVLLHRLIAVAKYGFDEVTGMVVHHKSEVEWDNRWSNIEIMTVEEHALHHHITRGTNPNVPWRDAELMRSLYVDNRLSISQIAEQLDCSDSAVRHWLDEHNIEIRDTVEGQKIRRQQAQQTLNAFSNG